MSVFSDILVSKVSEEVLPDWTVRTLKVEKVTQQMTPHFFIHASENINIISTKKKTKQEGRQKLRYL